MKKKIILNCILSILVLFALTSCKSKYTIPTDFSYGNLSGEIKSIKQKTYELKKVNDSLKSSRRTLLTGELDKNALLKGDDLNLTKIIYNKDGTKDQYLSLSPGDSIESKIDFIYKNGKRSRVNTYERDITVIRYNNYNKDFAKVRYTPFNLNNEIVYKYGKDIITEIQYFYGKKFLTINFIFESGNLSKRIFLDEHGKLMFEDHFSYNENGDLVRFATKVEEFIRSEEIRIYDDLNRIKQKDIYQYDSDGNYLESETFKYRYFGRTKLVSEERIITGGVQKKGELEVIYYTYYENEKVRSKVSDRKTSYFYEYEFDKKGNWIEKNIFKYLSANKKDPMYKIKREIEYY